MKLLACGALLLGLAVACQDDSLLGQRNAIGGKGGAESTRDISILYQGEAFGGETTRAFTAVAKSQAELDEALEKVRNGRSNAIGLIGEIDFDKKMVLVATLGTRPTTGYSVAITSLERTKDELRVRLAEIPPAHGTFVNHVETCPLIVATTDRTGAKVAFEQIGLVDR